MKMQEFIKNAVKAERQETLSKSDQLTVGEILLKLEPIAKRQQEIIDKYRHEACVNFDFEYLFPVGINSWRGSYDELALEFSCGKMPNSKELMTVTGFCDLIKSVIGKTFEGYKGGDFVMSRHTPVWVANYGNSGNTAVVDIIDNEHSVIIMTGYREF